MPGDTTNDLFAPRMPEVDIRTDIGVLFTRARAEAEADPAQRSVAVVTPGRMITFLPAPKSGTVSAEFVALARNLIRSERPLRIAVIAYTSLEAFMKDKSKSIPFLGQLLGLAYTGHNVIVFEGHESAFEAALTRSDALLIDSGMLPFLHAGWLDTAGRLIPGKSRILAYERKTGRIVPIVRSSAPPGWRYTEPDGEASYVNCLLTTLAKRSPIPVAVSAGRPLPDLTALAADPGQIEWAAGLPFEYGGLSPEKIIAIIQRVARWSAPEGGQTSGTLQTALAGPGGQRLAIAFRLLLAKEPDGKLALSIERSGA